MAGGLLSGPCWVSSPRTNMLCLKQQSLWTSLPCKSQGLPSSDKGFFTRSPTCCGIGHGRLKGSWKMMVAFLSLSRCV